MRLHDPAFASGLLLARKERFLPEHIEEQGNADRDSDDAGEEVTKDQRRGRGNKERGYPHEQRRQSRDYPGPPR